MVCLHKEGHDAAVTFSTYLDVKKRISSTATRSAPAIGYSFPTCRWRIRHLLRSNSRDSFGVPSYEVNRRRTKQMHFEEEWPIDYQMLDAEPTSVGLWVPGGGADALLAPVMRLLGRRGRADSSSNSVANANPAVPACIMSLASHFCNSTCGAFFRHNCKVLTREPR